MDTAPEPIHEDELWTKVRFVKSRRDMTRYKVEAYWAAPYEEWFELEGNSACCDILQYLSASQVRQLQERPRRKIGSEWIRGYVAERPTAARERCHDDSVCFGEEFLEDCLSIATQPIMVPLRASKGGRSCAWLAICNAVALISGDLEAAQILSQHPMTCSSSIPSLADILGKSTKLQMKRVKDTKGVVKRPCDMLEYILDESHSQETLVCAPRYLNNTMATHAICIHDNHIYDCVEQHAMKLNMQSLKIVCLNQVCTGIKDLRMIVRPTNKRKRK